MEYAIIITGVLCQMRPAIPSSGGVPNIANITESVVNTAHNIHFPFHRQ